MRVIAGCAKGRKLESIEGLATRPTLDRVKEAIFGSIQFDLPGAEVLDLFAGSGALSIEAVSRGAVSAVANDKNPACCSVIRKNVSSCGLSEQFRITNEDYAVLIDRLALNGKHFSFVFIDAPYAEESGCDALIRVFSKGIVAAGGSVVVEHAKGNVPVVPVESGIIAIKTKAYGSCGFSVFQKG